MKKEQDAAAKDTTPATAETNTASEATQQDASAPAPADHFDPDHEWPATGGCYVRQADGTLKRED